MWSRSRRALSGSGARRAVMRAPQPDSLRHGRLIDYSERRRERRRTGDAMLAMAAKGRQHSSSRSRSSSGSARPRFRSQPVVRAPRQCPSSLDPSVSLRQIHRLTCLRALRLLSEPVTQAALATLTRRSDPLEADVRQINSGMPRADTRYGVRKNVCLSSDTTTTVSVRSGGCLCVLLIPLACSFFSGASFTRKPS